MSSPTLSSRTLSSRTPSRPAGDRDRAAPRSYDVIVVGARAAGASTAMLLARAGLDVLVVERSRYGADTLSTHALMRGGVLQLHRWGLLDRIVAAGTPAVRRATFHCNGETSTIEIKPAHGTDALFAPRRTVLDTALVDAARDAGAEVRFGVRVGDLCRSGDGRVTGIVGRDTDGRPVVAHAPIVIGADGAASTVADLAGARLEATARATGAYVYGYWRDVPCADDVPDVEAPGYEWVFRSGAAGAGTSAGVVPTNDGLVCVFVGTSSERAGDLVRGGRDGYAAALRRGSTDVAGRVLAGTPVGRLRVFPGRPGHVREAWGPGWALVGDAGYWKDPLSAHGITDALRDAELLARAVIAAVDEGDGALGRYGATRDRLSRALWDVSEELAAHAWSPDELPPVLRRLSASMADEVTEIVGLDPLPTRTLHPICV